MSHNPKNSTGPEISKVEIRARAMESRRSLSDKDRRSCCICERFATLAAFAEAGTVLVYMHIRAEVRTTALVGQLLESGKRVVRSLLCRRRPTVVSPFGSGRSCPGGARYS